MAASFSGAATAFAFQSLAGENYDVQYSTTLSPANGQLLQHLTNVPGGAVSITNIPAGPQCFLGVLWLH